MTRECVRMWCVRVCMCGVCTCGVRADVYI